MGGNEKLQSILRDKQLTGKNREQLSGFSRSNDCSKLKGWIYEIKFTNRNDFDDIFVNRCAQCR